VGLQTASAKRLKTTRNIALPSPAGTRIQVSSVCKASQALSSSKPNLLQPESQPSRDQPQSNYFGFFYLQQLTSVLVFLAEIFVCILLILTMLLTSASNPFRVPQKTET